MKAEARQTVSPLLLPLLAGPLSFGITGPTLVLDDVSTELGVPVAQATALVTAFGWGIAVGTPLMGGLIAWRGPRLVLSLCTAIALAGTILLCTGQQVPIMVVGSGLQALGAAGFTVVAMSLASTAAAMAGITAALASVGAAAPLIGTHVSDVSTWRLTLALPMLSVAAVPAVLRRVPDRRADRPGGFDTAGMTALVGLITALVFLPHRALPAMSVSIGLAALLAAHVRRRPDGFIPSSVVGSPMFGAAALLAFGLAVVNFGIVYAAPSLLAGQTGWTSSQLGIALLVPYLIGGMGSATLVALAARLPFLALVTMLGGASVAAVVATAASAPLPLLFTAMTLGSLSAATGQGALALRAAAVVPDAMRPTAIGLFNLCYLLGAAFGPAITAAEADV